MSPNVYVIAGPNGAGKTTFAQEFLPRYANCENFINADMIAEGVAPFSPPTAAFRAGRLMLDEIGSCMRRGKDFGFEATLAGRGYVRLFAGLKKRGFRLSVFFLWIPTVEIALSRVRDRVLKGGHDVPEAVVRRRFKRSIRNFLVEYRSLADRWTLFDNSAYSPTVVAFHRDGILRIIEPELYERLISSFGPP